MDREKLRIIEEYRTLSEVEVAVYTYVAIVKRALEELGHTASQEVLEGVYKSAHKQAADKYAEILLRERK